MITSKSLLIVPALVAGLVVPVVAASPEPASHTPAKPDTATSACLAPAAFLTALADAGDWILKRELYAGDQNKLNGVVFRQAGMIDVALFRDGCLAMVVELGKAAPDLQV